MKGPQTFFALFCALAAAQAAAATLRVGPDPCPAPAAAEPYRPAADIDADPDAAVWVEESVVVFRDVPLGEKGLFARLDLDPETGLPYGVEIAPSHCEPAEQE